MLPNHTKFNDTRMFLKDKPHKWGTKLFLTCCPRTAYCMRLEVYCGKDAHLNGPQTIDDKSGPAAVLRNLLKVIPEDREGHHLVVMDRFYTSVALAVELLSHKSYSVGTIQPRRIGYPVFLKEKRKRRPANIARGSYRVARSKTVPGLMACCWWDSKPVHVLSTGASTQELTTVRNSWTEGAESNIPCPKVVKDFHRDMGGVDVYDQLRLQRYSVQMSFTFKKYYKTLALGLLDCALVNAFNTHRTCYKRQGKRPMSHVDLLTLLQLQLLTVNNESMLDADEIALRPPMPQASKRRPCPSNHCLTETTDIHGEPGDRHRKRMQRTCKVCTCLRGDGQRAKTTKYLCRACSEEHPGE